MRAGLIPSKVYVLNYISHETEGNTLYWISMVKISTTPSREREGSINVVRPPEPFVLTPRVLNVVVSRP